MWPCDVGEEGTDGGDMGTDVGESGGTGVGIREAGSLGG